MHLDEKTVVDGFKVISKDSTTKEDQSPDRQDTNDLPDLRKLRLDSPPPSLPHEPPIYEHTEHAQHDHGKWHVKQLKHYRFGRKGWLHHCHGGETSPPGVPELGQ